MVPFVAASLYALVSPFAFAGADSTPRKPAVAPVAIQFVARVAGAPFVCGQEYAALGATKTTASASEFMLFVSNVRLLRPDGSEVPVTLSEDGQFQHENSTLLDFAAGGVGTDCTNASPATNTTVRGTVATPGEFTGIRFVLGVPFEQNHQDQTSAPSPFSSSRMFWSWNGGYKFVRLDLMSAGGKSAWFVHLGSVGCTPGGSPTAVPTTCAEPNAPTITLTGFDPLTTPVIADIATLLATSNLAATRGCMSSRKSPGCSGVLTAFGVMAAAGASPAQRFFRIAP